MTFDPCSLYTTFPLILCPKLDLYVGLTVILILVMGLITSMNVNLAVGLINSQNADPSDYRSDC